jgi:hypothetical protein
LRTVTSQNAPSRGASLPPEPDLGLAPLAVAVDERHAHHGHIEHFLREPGHPVDTGVGRCVEHTERFDGALPLLVVEQQSPSAERR